MREAINLSSLLVFAAGTSACTSEAKKAERAYEIVSVQATNGHAICEAGRRVQQAYLDAGDAKRYHEWSVKADIECQRAGLTEG